MGAWKMFAPLAGERGETIALPPPAPKKILGNCVFT